VEKNALKLRASETLILQKAIDTLEIQVSCFNAGALHLINIFLLQKKELLQSKVVIAYLSMKIDEDQPEQADPINNEEIEDDFS
jgi:hypothetical protein